MVQHGFPEAFADGFLTLQAARRWYRWWHAIDVAGLPKHRLLGLGNRTGARGEYEWRGAYLRWRLACSMSPNHLEGRRLRSTPLHGLHG
jgi:hypothetical protein